MPVLSEHHTPSSMAGHQATTNTSTSSAYLFISLAILFTLGISISRRKISSCNGAGEKNRSFTCKRKGSDARMMGETPASSSALPGKPYLPNPASFLHAMEHQQATGTHSQSPENAGHENPRGQQFHSAPPPTQQYHQSHGSKDEYQFPTSASSTPQPARVSQSQPPPFQKRPGSLPAVTTSLLHPEPPSPTISMTIAPMKIQTQIPYQPHSNPPYDEQLQSQYPGQNPSQNQYVGQYTQNEILFVPSPTEYTSFEALYSKFPPPIYHAPNPTSYTSTTFSEAPSTHQTSSFSTTDGNPEYHQDSSVPRRRSYTKTLSNGSEMSGEIIVSGVEGGVTAGGMGGMPMPGQWRRHTRVFGGGVCRACEESENRRMSA